MRKYRNALTLVFLSTLWAGCLPATFTEVPMVKGRIVAVNGRSVAGAEIHIVETSRRARQLTLHSDEEGKFNQKEITRWTLAPLLPIDALGPKFELTAKHELQLSETIPFGGGLYHAHYLGFGNPAPKFDLGDVLVK